MQQASRADLDYLLRTMEEAECFEWALVIATVLQRGATVRKLLEAHPALQQAFKEITAQW